MDRVALLKRISESLEEAFGECIRGIVLYGSEARGEATPDSDIDILVLRTCPTLASAMKLSGDNPDSAASRADYAAFYVI